MAVRSVATTDTLETFRTTFNSLAATDIGDPASLTTTATSVVGAINELATEQYGGFTISDSGSSTTQTIGPNDNISFAGDSNISIAVTAQDTVTYTLNTTITGITSITSGAVQILDNRILTTDSTNLILQDIIGVSSAGAITGVTSFDATTLSEGGTRVATRPFAIAQAVALG